MNKLLIHIAVVVGVLSSFPAWAYAEFSLSPAVIDVDIAPRDILTETLVVENTGSTPIQLFPFVHNVTKGVEGGMQAFVAPSMSDRTASLASWIEISRRQLELPPGAKESITLTIRVAPDIKPGDYHAVIAYAPGTTVDDAQRLVDARAVPLTFVNATYVEKSDEHLNLAQFVVKRFVTSSEEDAASYRVENTGDTELVPEGDILIYNQRGEEVASVPLNPDRQSVKSGENATLRVALPVGDKIGKYKAFMTLRYGSEQAAVYDTVYFYALPWKKVLLAFGVFVALALALALVAHTRYRRRYDDEYDDEETSFDPDAPAALPLTVRKNASPAHHRDVVMKQK